MAAAPAATRDESQLPTAVRWTEREACEVGTALDQLKPSGSMTRGTGKSSTVCAVTPTGEAVARNGAFQNTTTCPPLARRRSLR
jgi:hypothetical protein